MKVLLIDVSINSSYDQVKSFIKSHRNADCFFIFDYEYGIYDSYEELLAELDSYRTDYFTHPCTFRDIVITILAKLRHQSVDVYLYSETIDDCSIYSTSESFENYIDHIDANSKINLYGFNPYEDNDSEFFKERLTNIKNSIFDRFLDKLSFFDLKDNYPDEYEYDK